MKYKMLIAIRIGEREVNCLYTFERKFFKDGNPAPVDYYDMLSNVSKILGHYNKGEVKDYASDVVKAVKLFEKERKRLKKDSYALAKTRYSNYSFLGDFSAYEESVAVAGSDLRDNQIKADFTVLLDLDKKTIQFDCFNVVSRNIVEVEYAKKDLNFEWYEFNEVDFDFDNLPIIDLDDFLKFVKSHNTSFFRLKGDDHKLVYLKENWRI